MKVESVRIIETCRNYQTVFDALHCLDNMVSGGNLNHRDKNIPMKLIKTLVDINQSLVSFDPYITSMVRAYIRRKALIAINFNGLKSVEAMIKGFLIEDKRECVNTTDETWNPESLSSSRSNLILPNVISIFPNAASIHINTKGPGNYQVYPFDMFYFAKSISAASNWKSITIKQIMQEKRNFSKSWIAKLWRLSESKLVDLYKKEGLNISFHKYEETIDHDYSYEYFEIVRV